MLTQFLQGLEALSYEIMATPAVIITASVLLVAMTVCKTLLSESRQKQLNPPNLFDFSGKQSKDYFNANAGKLLDDWFYENPDKPASIQTDIGPMIVLPAGLANEIRNDSRLDFDAVGRKIFHAGLPGFEVFDLGFEDRVKKVISHNLTKQLAQVTGPLSEETSLALKEIVGDDAEWHAINIRETALFLVARISSRVFLGNELCRDKDWLRITQEYTVTAFNAANELRLYPKFVRPVACRLLKSCRDASTLVAEARRVMAPVLEKRERLRREAARNGGSYQSHDDAIDWFHDVDPDGRYDPVVVQLGMGFAAIHTTSDLSTQTMADIAAHPDIQHELRDEIVSALREDGWSKIAIHKMKLLDSVIKESQRMKPATMTSMSRLALERICLSDSTVIRKGDLVSVTVNRMRDPSIHTNPSQWDPYRFHHMRKDSEKQHVAQLVSTSPDHLAFGHGQHACPGRFFAANEIKIALIMILLKYDFVLPEGYKPQVYKYGFNLIADPMAQLNFRRRKEDIPV